MIKLLKNKMLIALFLLVIGITVTSSCYADSTYTYEDFEWSVDNFNKTFTIIHIPTQISRTYDMGVDASSYTNYVVSFYSSGEYYCFGFLFCNSYKWSKYNNVYYLDSTAGVYGFLDFNGSSFGLPYGITGGHEFYDDFDYHDMAGRASYWINLSTDGIFYSNSGKIIDSTFDIITNPVTSEVIFDKSLTEKKIVYEITYDENNKKAQINASIKNAAEGDTLYYSTLGFKLNGKLLNPHEISQNDISYIPVSENGLIHLQALDSER